MLLIIRKITALRLHLDILCKYMLSTKVNTVHELAKDCKLNIAT